MLTKMKLAPALFTLNILCLSGASLAQLNGYNPLLPQNPTSADTILFRLPPPCDIGSLVRGNPYSVKMGQNNIVITITEDITPILVTLPPPLAFEGEIGKLPAGDYTLTLVNKGCPKTAFPNYPQFDKYAFTVTDARATKSAPYVAIDYSGHWWDPNDPGWGVFVSQDAKDNVLIAWLFYKTDGSPSWYVFQPKWANRAATLRTALFETSRQPKLDLPNSSATRLNVVGTASIDFDSLAGRPGRRDGYQGATLTYQFEGAAQQTRTLRRF